MRKAILFLSVFITAALLLPQYALAASATFSVSGPDTLQAGQTGTYTVKATVSDAAAVQATLHYDSAFFELVSGNPKGEWDNASNTSTTVTLITVTLKCVGATGSSGALTLSDMKASRLTGGNPPTEAVSCSGGSKTVSNPGPTPTPTTAPTRKSTPKPTATPTRTPTAAPTNSPTPVPTPMPTETPDAWAEVRTELTAAEGGKVSAQPRSQTVPADVLELVKEKRCVLTLDLGNCVCVLDGRDIHGIPVDELNLAVSLEKDAALSAAAGGADAWQIHLGSQGEFPGKFAYRFRAQGSLPGDALFLYCYYEKAGVVEGVQRATVDADGDVTFEFYHGRAYFVSDEIIDTAMNHFTAIETTADATPVGTPVAAPSVTWKTLILCAAAAALAAVLTWAAGKRTASRRTGNSK